MCSPQRNTVHALSLEPAPIRARELASPVLIAEGSINLLGRVAVEFGGVDVGRIIAIRASHIEYIYVFGNLPYAVTRVGSIRLPSLEIATPSDGSCLISREQDGISFFVATLHSSL